ncbi:MAG: HIRAN domain-containing protein [Ruminiclostridium sp.]
MKSKVMTIANALVKQGMSRSAAMVRAWVTVKLRRIETKTAGVTQERRQQLLARLRRYDREDVTITLEREVGNLYDSNAVKIIAAVRGKGSAVMGYINRTLAQAIAPLLDKGKAVKAALINVTGGNEYRRNYGLNIAISL